MHTQKKKLVGAIGATAAFTAALTGGITAVHQYSENAASADTVAGFNDFQNRIAQAKTAAADNSDHCKIHTGAFDELSYTPEPGESAHVSGSSFGLIGTSGTFNAIPADDGIAAYNCRWALTVKTNAVKYGIEGNELKDDVTVASDPTYGRDPWLVINSAMADATVHGQAYYTKEKPTTKTYTIPAGAQLIGETDLNFNEPGTKTASIAKPASLGNGGYIVWVWSVDRQKQPGNWGKYMDANYLDGWGAEDEVVTLPHQEEPTPTPTPSETTPAPTPAPTPGETTPTPKPTPSLPDHDGVTPPPAPVPTPAPSETTPEPTPAPEPNPGETTPTPKPSETTPAPVTPTPEETTPAPSPVPDPSTTTPVPNPSETTPAPVVPTPGETTPAPAPSTPGDATTDPTPAHNGTTEAPTPGSQENGDKYGKGGATNGSTNGTKNGNGQGTDQAGTKTPAGSTSVDHQGAALAHTGSTTLPLLGGAALLLAVGSGLALTKRRAINA